MGKHFIELKIELNSNEEDAMRMLEDECGYEHEEIFEMLEDVIRDWLRKKREEIVKE